jgi:hypothetical protein
MARLRGASGVVRPTRTIRSFAVVCGATIRSGTSLSTVGRKAASRENRLVLVQFDAEELGGDVGLFHGCCSMIVRVRDHLHGRSK